MIKGFFNKIKKQYELEPTKLPKHIAIIMDGNGRWAQKKGLPRTFGHKAGVEALKKIIQACLEFDIKILTVYAFSTENWKRPKDEINALMHLLDDYLEREIRDLHANKIKLNIMGDLAPFSHELRNKILNAVDLTKNNDRLIFNICLNYGGRSEILNAVKNILKEHKNNDITINEDHFKKYLYTKDLPDPDLLIRTGGEYRLSNFLLWQCAYTELYFTDVFWPDFDKDELYKAIKNYQKRIRRFGGL